MMAISVIPDIVNKQQLRCLEADDRVIDAAQHMDAYDVSAILIINDDGRLAGIVTEHDITRKIVAAGRDSNKTTINEIMTADPVVIEPTEKPYVALELMRSRRIRHLPIVDSGKPVGIVSMRDLRAGLIRQSRE